jgi:integrase
MYIREHLKLRSKKHQGVFRDALGHFLKIVPAETKIEDITSEHIANFIEYLKPKVENSTLLTYISYIRMLFNFLVEEEVIPKSPIRKKQLPKRIKKNIVFFNERMLDDILNLAQVRDVENNSNFYVFLKMLLLTGQRPIDVLGLTYGNIEIENNRIVVNISKTSKQIFFPLYDLLKVFIEEEIPHYKDSESDERIFKNLNSNIIELRFKRIKGFLEIKEKNIYTLKTFRKTFASYLASQGVDQANIADLLGHENAQTTRKYYAAVSTDNLRKELNKVFKVDVIAKSADISADIPKK